MFLNVCIFLRFLILCKIQLVNSLHNKEIIILSKVYSFNKSIMFDIFKSNRKISIVLLIPSILNQLLFIALLILKLVSRGLQSIPKIVLIGSCSQYFQQKYKSLLVMNSLTNSFLFIGIVIGLVPIIGSLLLLIKYSEEQKVDLKPYRLSTFMYISLSVQCLLAFILFGYELSFKMQENSCLLSFSIFTQIQFIISLTLAAFSLLFLGFFVFILLMINKSQQEKEVSSKMDQQQEQLVSKFQKKSKQMYESLLNKKEFKFNIPKTDNIDQNEQNEFKINIQNEKQHLNDKLQLQNQPDIYHDKSQFQSLKSQKQISEEETPRFVQERINQLKQLGFQMEYGDSQNKVKMTRGYMLPEPSQNQQGQKSKKNVNQQEQCISMIINLDKNNNPSLNQDIIQIGQQGNEDDQIVLLYEQSKQQRQIRKAKKRQVKRKMLELKISKIENQLCPLSNMIHQDQINEQQSFQKRIFEQKNQSIDFTIGAQLCLFKPKVDQFQKDSEDKMQQMYAQTLVCYKKQYMDRKQYEQIVLTENKQTFRNKNLFKNNPFNLLIQSNLTTKSKPTEKNKKQRKKMLEQMRGKRAD